MTSENKASYYEVNWSVC